MEKAFWIAMLIVMILIGMYGAYKNRGMDYSAGRGWFKNSDNAMPEDNREEFSDYNPYDYDDLRK